jgi:hypothetical protein
VGVSLLHVARFAPVLILSSTFERNIFSVTVIIISAVVTVTYLITISPTQRIICTLSMSAGAGEPHERIQERIQ